MDRMLLLQYLALGSLLLFSLLSIKLIRFLKKRKNNVPLWATVFEGMTMGLVNLDLLKAPETRIEKKSRKDGKEELPEIPIDLPISLRDKID